MSNILRAALAQAVTAKPDQVVDLHLSPAMESRYAEIADIEGFEFNQLGLETQQMQAHVSNLVEQAIIDKTTPQQRATVPSVYVVSGKGLMDGSVDEQGLLRDAVRKKLDAGAEVAVALLPVEHAALVTAPEESPQTATQDVVEPTLDTSQTTQAARQFLSTVDIPVLESIAEIHDFLNSRRADPTVA